MSKIEFDVDLSELDSFLHRSFNELGVKAVEPTPRETEALRVMMAENIRLTIQEQEKKDLEKIDLLDKVEALFRDN